MRKKISGSGKIFHRSERYWQKLFSGGRKRDRDIRRIFPDFVNYDTMYAQAHKPVRKNRGQQKGHAVRANYMYSAMADLAYEYQDKELQQACRNLWDNMVHKKNVYYRKVLDLLDSWNDLQQIMICQMTAIILRHVLRLHLLCLEREWQIWRRMLLIWM